ncbi:MAG: HypC/HybG/HupF family hydrogenase formation chaperone [bacterium]
MCLAIPGQIISIDESIDGSTMAITSFGGIKKSVCVDLVPEVKIGDYVLVHVGFALNIIDEKEAEETIELINEIMEAADNG